MKNSKSNSKKSQSASKSKSKKSTKPTLTTLPKPEPVQCSAFTADGARCKQNVMEGKTHCTDHRPAADHLSAEEKKALSRVVKGWKDPVREVISLIGWWKAREMARKAVSAPQPPSQVRRSETVGLINGQSQPPTTSSEGAAAQV